MCGGGGDAAKAAQQQEAQRQAGITNAIGQIHSIYASPERQQQYTDFQNALQQRNLLALNKQQADANRNLNFAMARQGLTGGSADADSAAQQERLYNEGLLKGNEAATSAAAQLRASDQQQKQNLIGLAESGLDATSAANQGLESMQTTIQNAMANAQAQDIGDAFSGLGSYFQNSQQAAQYRKLLQNPSGQGLFSPTTPYTGPGSMGGYAWLSNPSGAPGY
jgi:hypothetical protein